MRKIFALILIALLLGVGVVAMIETDPAMSCWPTAITPWKPVSGWAWCCCCVSPCCLYAVAPAAQARGRAEIAGQLAGCAQARQASRLTTRGLVSYIEGNWAKARRELLRGARNNEAPLVNYLLAARSSARLGEPEQIERAPAGGSGFQCRSDICGGADAG